MRVKRIPALDARLGAIAKMVTPGVRLADIGTDHGRLIVALAASGRISRGYACDLREKPLQKAQAAVRKAGVEDRVEVLLGDGFEALQGRPFDEAVIAGMGGETIAQILQRAPETRNPNKRYLQQPMSRAGELRIYLCSAGYKIEQENLAESAGRLYSILAVRWDGLVRPCDLSFSETGLIAEQKSLLALRYLRGRKAEALRRGNGLLCRGNDRQQAQRYLNLALEISKRISRLEQELLD